LYRVARRTVHEWLRRHADEDGLGSVSDSRYLLIRQQRSVSTARQRSMRATVALANHRRRRSVPERCPHRCQHVVQRRAGGGPAGRRRGTQRDEHGNSSARCSQPGSDLLQVWHARRISLPSISRGTGPVLGERAWKTCRWVTTTSPGDPASSTTWT